MHDLVGLSSKLTKYKQTYIHSLSYVRFNFYARYGNTKEDLCVEGQERGKKCALIIKSSVYEGILIFGKGVTCESLEIVPAKKYFL